jgi:hypothetical protein
MGRRSFPREFKLEALKLVFERGVTIAQAFPGRVKERPVELRMCKKSLESL